MAASLTLKITPEAKKALHEAREFNERWSDTIIRLVGYSRETKEKHT
jgi:hypothetical protein